MGNLADNNPNQRHGEKVAALATRWQPELQNFLVGLLQDTSLSQDVLQTTLVKLLEQGGEVADGALKSWIFRVAFNEAMEIRRRHSLEYRHQAKVAWWWQALRGRELTFEDKEQADRVRVALGKLPVEQRQVVQLRIYEGLKFHEIARQLEIPLGTVLTRMRAALGKLKSSLGKDYG